ncbi:hypothetical protein HDU97_001281 [Phlyctochytrium planicorne]|nr:hypothetical protein HDU97_001281 [Phlyctochytrium planicorne]
MARQTTSTLPPPPSATSPTPTPSSTSSLSPVSSLSLFSNLFSSPTSAPPSVTTPQPQTNTSTIAPRRPVSSPSKRDRILAKRTTSSTDDSTTTVMIKKDDQEEDYDDADDWIEGKTPLSSVIATRPSITAGSLHLHRSITPSSSSASSNQMTKLTNMLTDVKLTTEQTVDLIEHPAGGLQSQQQMKVVLEHAKKMVVQLKGLVEVTGSVDLYEEDGQLPSYDQLVERLNDAFKNQQQINALASRITSVNYIANLANYAKTRTLQKTLARGKRQIMELQDTISTLEESVDTLTDEVEVQKRGGERLKAGLEGVKGVLEEARVEYRKELMRQGELIKKQQAIVGDVYQSKLSQDFIIDSTLLMFSIYVVNTFIFEYPLHGLVQIALKNPRRKRWARQAGKAIVVWILWGRLRGGAARYGVHHR